MCRSRLRIARGVVVHKLAVCEIIVADSGYRDRRVFDIPTGLNNPKQRMQQVAHTCSRHETVNARFKTFKVLSTPFRGELSKHYMFFTAIAVIIHN